MLNNKLPLLGGGGEQTQQMFESVGTRGGALMNAIFSLSFSGP